MTDTANNELLKTQRKDVYFIDARQIEIEEGFNVRVNYGDVEGLADSIQENGVKVPLRGFKRNGIYILTDGHRRLAACKMLIEQGVKIRVPFIAEREQSMEQRVVDMIVCNDGLKLNPLEEAEAVSRLLNHGWTEKEISKATGKTGVYISNLKLLHSAPKKIKLLIEEGAISATLVMEILRDADSFDEALTIIETAVRFVLANKKSKKITKRDIEASQNKTNSVSACRKVFKKSEGRVVRAERQDLYEFAQRLLNGEYTKEELDILFFEPDVADEGSEE